MEAESVNVKDTLARTSKLWSRQEVLTQPSPVPSAPGVYAWYISGIADLVPVADCYTSQGLPLVYVGMAPKKDPANGRLPSRQTLCSRIRYHFRGNAAGSTLRLTLGCVLTKQLGIELRHVGSGERLTFADGELSLSKWMDANAEVVWCTVKDPWLAESGVISSTCLPLNLDQNKSNSFQGRLSSLRSAARIRARSLPVVSRTAAR